MIKKTLLFAGGVFLFTTALSPYYDQERGKEIKPSPNLVSHPLTPIKSRDLSLHIEGFSVKDKENIAQILNLIPNKKPMVKLPSYRNIKCLAQNIYHEAHTESIKGQVAVGFATLSRVKSKKYPNSICGVIKAKGQMSWYKDIRKRDKSIPRKYYSLAKDIILGKFKSPTCEATHWYNSRLDSRKSFNVKQFLKGRASCAYKAYRNSNHVFMAYYEN